MRKSVWNLVLMLSEQLKILEERFFIRTRYVELDQDWYRTAAVPMLARTDDGRWLAVIPKTDGTCFFMEQGRKVKVTPEKAEKFTDSAMYFYRELKKGRILMRDLVSFLFRCSSGSDRIIVLTASVLATLAGMLLPWVNSFIFSRIIPAGEMNGIPAAAALLFAAVMTAAVLKLLQSLVLTNSMVRCGTYVQSAIFSRLLSAESRFFPKSAVRRAVAYDYGILRYFTDSFRKEHQCVYQPDFVSVLSDSDTYLRTEAVSLGSSVICSSWRDDGGGRSSKFPVDAGVLPVTVENVRFQL